MGMYYESFRVEAREQLRLVYAFQYGNPGVDATKYIQKLEYQANPPDKEEAEELGLESFKRAAAVFGGKVKADTGKIIYKKN